MKSIIQIFCISILFLNFVFSIDNDLPLCKAKIDTPVILPENDKFFQAGRFYFGAQPDDSTFQWFADQGVKIVFNLRTENEMNTLSFDQDSLLKSMAIKYIHIPISSKSGFCPASVDTLAKYLKGQHGNALIHCARGGRVTLLWMAYLVMYRNISLDDAVKIGKKMYFKFPLEKLLGKKVSMRIVD